LSVREVDDRKKRDQTKNSLQTKSLLTIPSFGEGGPSLGPSEREVRGALDLQEKKKQEEKRDTLEGNPSSERGPWPHSEKDSGGRSKKDSLLRRRVEVGRGRKNSDKDLLDFNAQLLTSTPRK